MLRVEGDRLILGRVLRNKVIPDGQAAQAVFEMDDQPFAGKYLESGRWIEIAAGLLPVGCRAAEGLVVEKEKILDRCRDRVERCLALLCGEPNFEDALLARQNDTLSELGPNREIVPNDASAVKTARIPSVSNLHQRPAWSASLMEDLCMKSPPDPCILSDSGRAAFCLFTFPPRR